MSSDEVVRQVIVPEHKPATDEVRTRRRRIGVLMAAGEPFWVLVREAIFERARQLHAILVPLESDLGPLATEDRIDLLEELLAQDLDAVILQGADETLARLIVDAGVPLLSASEMEMGHPLVTSPRGIAEAATIGINYLVEQLGGQGHVLLAGGAGEGFDSGASRVRACLDVLSRYPDIAITHAPTPWLYSSAYEALERKLSGMTVPFKSDQGRPFDGVFGISDPLALAGRDAAAAAGLLRPQARIVGINGDPLALAAILAGEMTATVRMPAMTLGRQLIELAVQAADGQALPPHFDHIPQLVTQANVLEAAAEKLANSAAIPSRLVGFSRARETQRLKQLETSLAITQQVDSILDRRQLQHHLAEIIRANYDYDRVSIYLWDEANRELVREPLEGSDRVQRRIPLDEAGPLGYALLQNRPIFVPDMARSQRFPPDPRAANCRSRVVLPIHFGQQILGLLDLQSGHSTEHSHLDLIGLQVLGDQLGVAIRNAELYGEAVAAQEEALRANQIKTRLLANVSHEFRNPLNIIQGYSQSALAQPNPYRVELPPLLLRDLRYLFQSSEHLGRLVNDLLDLARAESNDLEVFPEPIDTNSFLDDVFQSMSGSIPHRPEVQWRLELPEELPEINADPIRLRQVLLNLLSNACKFTERGHIRLGGLAADPFLHLWVDDTGAGIPLEQQKSIFRAFITAEQPRRPAEGIGLGLRVTHELVKLHGGMITFASIPGAGATFHVYLPLPVPDAPMVAATPPLQGTLAGEQDLPPYANDLTRQTVAYLRRRFADQPLSRAQIAAHVAASESYLTRVFRRDLGITPWEYLTRLRLDRAKDLLHTTSLTIAEIANQVGYNDGAYFSRVFHQETGRSPLAFRRYKR